MRRPSAYAPYYALVAGLLVLLSGLALPRLRFAAAPPAEGPPVPAGEVAVGPLTTGAPLVLDPLEDGLAWEDGAPSAPFFYDGGTEEDEEMALFHLAGFSGFEAPAGPVEPFGLPAPFHFGAPGAAGTRFEAPAGPREHALLLARRPSFTFVISSSSLSRWQALRAALAPAPPLLPPLEPAERPGDGEPLRITFPPVFAPALDSPSLVFGGVNYADPARAGLPLLRVAGYEHTRLSPGFRVGDFAARDGAPLARISPRLVQGLEALRAYVGSLVILSGYRHPAHNAVVRGSRVSQHMAGQAADLWSPTRGSVELARYAVAAFGCGVGLGLGRNTLHVDVRGHLATWTYPGAPLSEWAFDLWVRLLCDGVEGDALGSLLEVEWAQPDSLGAGGWIDRLPWLVGEGAGADGATGAVAARLLQRQRLVLAAYVRDAQETRGPGAVVVDLTGGVPPETAPLSLSYAPLGSPEAERLGVAPLVAWVLTQRHEDEDFVYAVRFAGGHVSVGIMGMGGPSAAPPPGPAGPGSAPVPPSGTGRLSVVVRPWGTIVLDGAVAARETDVRYEAAVAAGPHRVRAEHPVLGSREVVVSVGAGETAEVVIDLADRPAATNAPSENDE
jgi:hypothetical protein